MYPYNPIFATTDASNKKLGDVISHINNLLLISRRLINPELRYNQRDKKLLLIVELPKQYKAFLPMK